MNDISLRNQRESPFLRLPGEVRNRIYEHALGGKHISYLYPRLYSADRNHLRKFGHNGLEANIVPKLLHLTITCRQIHDETDLLIFRMNDFCISANFCLKAFDVLSQRQLGAIKTCIWPRQCEYVTDFTISKFTGLQRLVVRETGYSGDDFYAPEDSATPRVHVWYEGKRRVALGRIDGWKAKGIEIEYCK
ncbi:hypothetical protein BU25DRAFT_461074 [Macroventuria anomochaeta]|uniref:Uncharacterized protein n=1 Tax=Macroventuria anomochaeta TaxID=301207 RepID=A0ACB6RUG9_9PLEO|nr:uncharacterized protein BU25DRAFT_461074 [Macroventuria anomochaeta]KAF2624547.1 hypothetical protein BU25DRAFT_461074 [Macroventuria anomochaeta]